MNNPLWRLFSGTVRGFNQLMAYLSALLILICSLVLVYEVVTRYILNISNDWVIELSIFMLIAATFLAAAHTQRERGHVGIEILDEVMSKRASRIRLLLGDILSMLFCGLVAYLSAVYCHEALGPGLDHQFDLGTQVVDSLLLYGVRHAVADTAIHCANC
jgi:TRAP-type C4-dicarboxylate transport system permease small subunit